MANPQFEEIQEPNPWNPFDSTKRDIKRTEQLAKKNAIAAGLITFLFPPAAMIYLNRGVNSLKIWGYVTLAAMAFAIITEAPEEDASQIGETFGYIGLISIVVENINTVTRAKKRHQSSLIEKDIV